MENVCRLCATQQEKGQALFVVDSEELDKLVIKIFSLLGTECRDDGLHPKWLCSECQLEARNTEQFIQLVKSGQRKLMKMLNDCHDEITTNKLMETKALTVHDKSQENGGNLQNIVVKHRKRCSKYKQRKKQEHQVIAQKNELEVRMQRTRRRPQRFLEETEVEESAKMSLEVPPLAVKLENEFDSCTLITSQPIAELRTATGNALGEIVEVETNKDKENLSLTKTYFICEYCKAVFARENAFLKHIETHKNCIYECNECLEGFSNKALFSQHQSLTGHIGVGIIEDNSAGKDLVLRDKKDARQTSATAAINIVVGANGQITSIDQMDTSETKKANDDGLFSAEDSMEIHDNDCAKLLPNSKKYACLSCPKTFEHPYAARRHHKLVHVAERTHKCSLCTAAFKTKYNYDLHLATHTGEKNFACNFCSKLFKTKHEWKIHNRVHTGEKPFKCFLCSKTFANRCNLVTHKRVHTGERPYKCSNCEAGFTTASHLKKHKQMHLRAAQRKLKAQQNAGVSQKPSKPKEKVMDVSTNDEDTLALVKFKNTADKSFSLLKPRSKNIQKSIESNVVHCELSARPRITNVQILPAISAYSDSNELSTRCIQTSQINDLYPELPSITNVQILPAIDATSYTDQLKTNPNNLPNSNILAENLKSTNSIASDRVQFKFQCPTCQKQFKQSGAMKKHQRTHTGERPYKCPICPKSFADPSNFKKHRIIHKNVTHALKNVCTSKSSTMQELRQMLAEQSVTITSHTVNSSAYAASDPDPDGLDTLSRSFQCASDFANAAETLNEHNTSFSAALGNFMSWNRFDNALPPAEYSLQPLTDVGNMDDSISAVASENQLICISYQDPVNPIAKSTTYYVVN